jgi:DNA-binding XRE family transcriptional regulator
MRRNLRTMRLGMGLSQETLGRIVGVGKSMMSALETGKANGSVSLWDRLEAVSGVPQQELRLDSGGKGKGAKGGRPRHGNGRARKPARGAGGGAA